MYHDHGSNSADLKDFLLGVEDDGIAGRVMEFIDPWVAPKDGSQLETARTSIKLPWDTVCTHFQTLYINWDPQMFELSETYHL